MGSSMTPLAPRDAAAPALLRSARPGSLSPGLLVAVKVVLGVVGFAGCALLGYGGGLLIKHFLPANSALRTSAAHVAPIARMPPEPGAPASSAALSIVPGPPVQAVASLPDTSSNSPDLAAPASAIALGRRDAAIDAPIQTAQISQPPASPHIKGKRPDGVRSEGSATSARVDRASCLATVNAITSDLSLRNEPPTPQQLAILKRGCK